MIKNLLLLNGLKSVDVLFFICCGVVVLLIIGVYFLIPVFNKQQYAVQRENLKKREDAFKSNKKTTAELESLNEADVSDVNDSVDAQNVDTTDDSDN